MHTHMNKCTRACKFLWNPIEGVSFLGAGIMGGCKLLDVGAGNGAGFSARAARTLSL